MNPDEVDILLVDDSQDDVDLTLHALRTENLANRVFIARDGEEALDFLFCSGPHAHRSFEHPPKLVLLDLKLPKVDGMQVWVESQAGCGSTFKFTLPFQGPEPKEEAHQ